MAMSNLERAYRAYTYCRDLIRSSTSEQQLFDSVCDAVVAQLGYRLAWVGLLSQDSDLVQPVAQAGFEEGYLSSIRISFGDDDLGRGPTGEAIRTRHPSVCQNIATDERFAPWREDALRRGYASSAALPLLDGSACIGALNIYARAPDAFDDDELALLEEVAVDLQLGIRQHRQRARLEAMSLHIDRAMRAEVAALAATAIYHDINNLLQVISSSISMARAAPDRLDFALGHAEEATNKIAALGRQLLSLGRRATQNENTTDIDRIIRAIEPLLERLARNATLELDLDATDVPVSAPGIDLDRVLINLVVNAEHAMPSGGRLRISTRTLQFERDLPNRAGVLPPGHYVELAVSDEGEGIAPDVLPKIFEPFFSTKDEAGTGLGLPAVLDLVGRCRGGLQVQSEVGEGTRFELYFPILGSG
jgi:signal transduction histidine kinase